MKMSRLASRTLREAPGGTQTKGHEHLLRAGYIRQQAAGIFSSLPLGFRSLAKIEGIIREEMNAIGGQEISMPVVNAGDIWKESGRFYAIDKELSRFQDRYERDMVLAMTHEEAVTDLMRQEIVSYKQLPSLVYQIQTKWRDDARPRAGLIRVREFVMKDSYSFDTSVQGMERQYQAHYEAYFRIFHRCGLPVVAVGADSGMMGGKVSHEYMYLSPMGEDTIIRCPKCGYTANRQVALFKKNPLTEEPLPLEEVATPETKTIEELTRLLEIPASRTAKAVFMTGTFAGDEEDQFEDKLVMAVIRGDLDIEEAKLLKAAGATHLKPAAEEEIRACGMVPGYASPIGAAGDFVLVVDDSVSEAGNLTAGANKEGFHTKNTNYGRDYKGRVADIASAREGDPCPHCDGVLQSSRGVEVGNIFQLGTRYSESMNCTFQDENGREQPVVMGSYGIGVGRLLACVAEESCSDKGLVLPLSVAPYSIHLVSLLKKNPADPQAEENEADRLYQSLTQAGFDVLYDDRKESPGVKFNDADLMGIPLRVTIGNRSLKEGGAEVANRAAGSSEIVALEDIVSRLNREKEALEKETANLG